MSSHALPTEMLSPAFLSSLGTLALGLRDLDHRHKRLARDPQGWRMDLTYGLARLLSSSVPGRLALLLGEKDALLYNALPNQDVAAVALGRRIGEAVVFSGTLFWGTTDATGTLVPFDSLPHLEGLGAPPAMPFWDVPQLPSLLHAPAWFPTRDALVQAFLGWADDRYDGVPLLLRAHMPRLDPLTGRIGFHAPLFFVDTLSTVSTLMGIPEDPHAVAFVREAEDALLACGLTPLDLAAESLYYRYGDGTVLFARSDETPATSAHVRLQRRIAWDKMRARDLPPPRTGLDRRYAPHQLSLS